MYCASWFLTLFAFNWPTELVTRIWDIFFCESQEIVQRVALCFMRLSQGTRRNKTVEFLMKATGVEDAIPHFQNPWGTVNPDKLLVAVASASSLTKEIKKLETEFESDPNKKIMALSC